MAAVASLDPCPAWITTESRDTDHETDDDAAMTVHMRIHDNDDDARLAVHASGEESSTEPSPTCGDLDN